MSAPGIVDRLERNLMSLGVYVERSAHEKPQEKTGETKTETKGEEILHLEYETAAPGLTNGDLGNVCSELRGAYEDGWEPKDCRFWAFDTEWGFYGHWDVRAGWLRALDRGDLSETDFSTLILSTRTPAEEPPSPVPAFGVDGESKASENRADDGKRNGHGGEDG